MILNGEFDFLTPRALHETLRLQIPDSALVIIPRAFHAFTLEKPALTADLLSRFAEDVRSGNMEGRPLGVDRSGAGGRSADPLPVRLRPSARNSGARRAGMSTFLGPLDATGRVPPRQQTRVAAFLVSCHGAMARQLRSPSPGK